MNPSHPLTPERSDPPRAADPSGHRLSRRTLVGGAAAAAAVLTAGVATSGFATSASASDRERTPRGRGSVSEAPDLPPGFSGTFSSRYVNAGDVRHHAVTGGDGPPLLLVHGWPQTWYAWRLVMPTLAQHFFVVAVDQRGIGLSDKPLEGYDSATLAGDMVALMAALGHERFFMYGTDVGMPIAYAVAADHPAHIDRLVVSEAPIPGVSPVPALILPPAQNARFWHLAFNSLPAEVNEALVKGREDIFFGAEFDAAAGTIKLPDRVVDYYVRILRSGVDPLRGSFSFYREWLTTADQNMQRQMQRLTIPVLAIGGAESGGENVATGMRMVADNVQSMVIPGVGHWVAEQAPEQISAALTAFLIQ